MSPEPSTSGPPRAFKQRRSPTEKSRSSDKSSQEAHHPTPQALSVDPINGSLKAGVESIAKDKNVINIFCIKLGPHNQ